GGLFIEIVTPSTFLFVFRWRAVEKERTGPIAGLGFSERTAIAGRAPPKNKKKGGVVGRVVLFFADLWPDNSPAFGVVKELADIVVASIAEPLCYAASELIQPRSINGRISNDE